MKNFAQNFQRLLWWIACSDKESLDLCSPVTRYYQTTVGLTIFNTVLLALLSGGYAIHQVTRNVLVTIPIAALYASGILCVDRLIVAGRGSHVAWCRLPLAVVIGAVIAVPIEIRMMDARIDQELARQEQALNHQVEDRRIQGREELGTRMSQFEKRADEYRQQIAEWGARMEAEVVGRVKAGSTGVAGLGPAHNAASEQRQLATELLNQTNVELERLRKQEPEILARVDAEYERAYVAQSRDLLAKYQALHAIERQHPEAAKMAWGITLLIMLMEVLPALTKLLLPYTAYAALVEAREREDIQRVHAMANNNISDIAINPANRSLFVVKQTAKVKYEAEESEPNEHRHASI